MADQSGPIDDRVLILAPTSKDATTACHILDDIGIAAHVCRDVQELCREAGRGAGAALLAEEHLLSDSMACVAALSRDQPPWSDFPLVVLLGGGEQSPAALDALKEIGNMTLSLRPVQIAGLVSTIQAALRDRRRQYAVRDLLAEREHVLSELALDVEQRKETEQHLRDSEEQFRQLADAIPQLAWTAQADGFIDWYNSRWYEYTGTTAEQMQGWGWQSVHDPEVLPHVMAEWNASLATGDPFDMVFPLRGADGKYRPFLTRVMPFRNIRGTIVRWFGTNTDITQQRELQEQLRKVAADLSDADRRKDEFLAMLAHELRNPLAAISSALYLLNMPRATAEDVVEARAIANRQVAQLKRLVDDLMDISRITRGKVKLQKERFNLVVAVRRAIETTRPLIDAHRHELIVALDEDQELLVNGDPARIEQILINLLSNAAKYTENGGKITLSVHQDGSHNVVQVRDTGVGISADVLPTIFDLFAQAPRSLDRSEGGLGIGLTLVKALVELHGGSISVSSVQGEGSEFMVRLPAVLPRAARPGGAAKPEPRGGGSRRVLVVDDNRDSARMLGTLLEFQGHQVFLAYDGLEAVHSIRHHTPEVVLLDIGLPGLNGFEVAEQIRHDRSLRQPMIIAVSGYGQAEDRRRSQAAGFDAHLVKPLDQAQLMTLLAQAGES